MARCGQLFSSWEELKIVEENDVEDKIDVEIVDISDSDESETEIVDRTIEFNTIENDEDNRIKSDESMDAEIEESISDESSKDFVVKNGESTISKLNENVTVKIEDDDAVNCETSINVKNCEIVYSLPPNSSVPLKSEFEPMTFGDIMMPQISVRCLYEHDAKETENNTELILPCDTTAFNYAEVETVKDKHIKDTRHVNDHFTDTAELEEHPNLVPFILKEGRLSFVVPDSTTNIQPTRGNVLLSDNWDGAYNFKIKVKVDPVRKKNDSAVFWDDLQKLYTSKDFPFCILCNAENVPSKTYIRATCVFLQAGHKFDVVKRCPTHAQEDAKKGINQYEHVVQSLSKHAVYETNSLTGRCSVVVPYEVPQDGAKESEYIYKLTCYSSCLGGLNRRAAKLLFTLEKDGKILGRQSIEVKVCACPSRDMRLDQNKIQKTRNYNYLQEVPPIESLLENSNSSELDQPRLAIKVKDAKLYEFLKDMKMLYETCNSALNILENRVATRSVNREMSRNFQ